MKLIVIIAVTTLLQILCQRGQETIAWLIVFIPFIFMSVVVGILLFVFGLDPTTGKIKPPPPNVTQDASGNIVVYDPYYNPRQPAYYKSPNVIVPVPMGYTAPTPYEPETKTISTPNTDITTTTISTG